MKKILVIILLFLSPVCYTQEPFNCEGFQTEFSDTRKLIDSLKQLELNSDTLYYDDTIDNLNKNLVTYLSTLTIDDRFQTCSLEGEIGFLVSDDKQFCIASWDTRQGGTMTDYTNAVIYKTKNQTTFKQLKYGDDEYTDNSKIFFDTLFTLQTTNGVSIYITYGYGQGSTALPYRVVKAFMITDSLKEDVPVFPSHKSELWIEYDLNHLKSRDDVLEIIFIDNGKKMKIPVQEENSRPTKKYYTLTFNGSVFIRD